MFLKIKSNPTTLLSQYYTTTILICMVDFVLAESTNTPSSIIDGRPESTEERLLKISNRRRIFWPAQKIKVNSYHWQFGFYSRAGYEERKCICLNCKMFLSKLKNVLQLHPSKPKWMMRHSLTDELVEALKRVDTRKGNVFVSIAKCICPNLRMYLQLHPEWWGTPWPMKSLQRWKGWIREQDMAISTFQENDTRNTIIIGV